MVDQSPPPPRPNGYVWVARVALPMVKANALAAELDGIRHELAVRDVSALGDPLLKTEVELWAHPDDQRLMARILGRLLGE